MSLCNWLFNLIFHIIAALCDAEEKLLWLKQGDIIISYSNITIRSNETL